ncbi:autotransporter assembly complex protein TamA [Sphingobium lignivorans]|uniref:Translocation and assembly module TamA n=1 Tax=Sphingobium lignivorans TaxID=2735886 RepID=A0ABR6NCY3_9SPHN|nr:BamA/TamA family outer membrane protein [Sphingobium lignivorans]MBB5984921.1 translocation and assembly module TamA [Sphingobium lignivorans]
MRLLAASPLVLTALIVAGQPVRARQPAVPADPPVLTGAEADDAAPSDAQPDEPIISDEEFDESIPPISDDPAGAMGSVSDWEAEADRRAATSGEQALPPVDDIGAPLPDDPEADQPLTPIEAFDVEPFDDSRYTEEEESRAAETRYNYSVEGLDTLNEAGSKAPVDADTIRAQFQSLSALEDGDGRAANGAMINARLEEDQKLLADILSSHGFFDSSVRGSLQLGETGSDDPVRVLLEVTPGPRYVLGAIRFDAAPVIPEDLIVSAFKPQTGDPIEAEDILAGEASIAVELPQNGYPFVEIGERDILLDAETRTGDYTLPVTPGPRSSFGDIVNRGEEAVFEPGHIERIARFRKGELYDSRKVDDLRRALVATGLFSVVSVDPEPSGVPAGDGTDYATLVVSQEAGPPRTLAAQAGYETGQGIKIDGSWTHRNMFPPEGALVVQGTAGTQEQGLGVAFRRSNAGRRDRTVELGVDARRSDFEAYEALTGRLYGRVSYDSTPIWQKRWTYNYGFELIGTNEQDYDFDAGERRRRTYYVLALPGQITFDTSNSLLDPTRGFRLSARISPESSLGSGAQAYARTLFEGTGYYPVSDDVVLAGRARVGMIGGAARAQIAPSRRFYGGGGGSVRGFGYQELGPKDPDNRPIGGRSLVEAAAEVRYRFGNYGIVGFIDGGQVYTSEMPRFTDWRFGVGIGGRFYTNFGPMRLDVATPINRQPGESRVSVYISIGQAF